MLAFGAAFYSSNAQVVISMEKRGGVYYLPGKINGLELQFVFDTGASNVYLSMTEALFMVKNGYLSPDDFTGKVSQSLVANGSIEENMEVVLREIELGGIILKNIKANVSQQFDTPLLLGQTVIQELGPIQLDGNKLIITTKNAQRDNDSLKEMTDRVFKLAEYGDLDESLKLSLEVVAKTKDPIVLSRVYDNMGYIYISKGDLTNAAESFKKATENDPSNIQPEYNYGVALFEQEQYEKAAKVFKNVVLRPQNLYSADAYAYLGLSQMKLGEASNAKNSFLSSLRLRPNASADFGLADYYFSINQLSSATKYLEDGIAFEPSRPSNVKRLYQLGYCYSESGSIDKAKDALRRCETLVSKLWGEKDISGLEPDLVDMFAEHMFYATRSSVLLARIAEEPTDKIRQYNKVWRLRSAGVFDLMDYLQYSYLLSAMGDVDKAREIVMGALEEMPNNPDILFMASDLTEEPSEIITILSNIIPQEYEYTPVTFDYGTVYNNIAWAHHCSGESAKGLPFAEKAVKKNPEHAYSWETLGEIYFSLGRYSDCVEAMTKCITCDDPEQMKDAYLYRGKSLEKLGKRKEGQKDIKYSNSL